MTEQNKNRYELVEVPTETSLMVKDIKTNETLSQLDFLVRIANDINEIRRGLIGEK